MGAGGARVSEVMHLYAGDFGFDAASQEARVTLADPQTGEVKSEDFGGAGTLTREEFLRIKYGRTPRNMLPDTDVLRAGWKRSIRKGFSTHPSQIVWIHSIYGQIAWAAHTTYFKQRALACAPPPMASTHGESRAKRGRTIDHLERAVAVRKGVPEAEPGFPRATLRRAPANAGRSPFTGDGHPH